MINLVGKLILFMGCSIFFITSCSPPTSSKSLDEAPRVMAKLTRGDVSFPDSITLEEQDRILDKISKRYLMGQYEPSKDKRFSLIPTPYAQKKMYMRKEALTQFKSMYAAAKKEGVRLRIVSATRPFNAQKSIWEAKWRGKRKVDGKLLNPKVKDPVARAKKILRWSSMPSTSRHHWGTDIDINSVNPEYFETAKGKKEYEWLVKNAPAFGYCQVYSPMGIERPDGYQEEKWHWSYLPIAGKLTQAYAQQIGDKDIKGFEGATAAAEIQMVQKYVLGINKECLPVSDGSQ